MFVTDILTAQPVNGAKVTLYNSVNQVIGEGTTGSGGRFTCSVPDDEARTIIVSKGNDKSYLSMNYGNSISMSGFEVDGNASQKGQKGFIFGERGVWRPGDDIHITFVSMLEEGVLPRTEGENGRITGYDAGREQGGVRAAGNIDGAVLVGFQDLAKNPLCFSRVEQCNGDLRQLDRAVQIREEITQGTLVIRILRHFGRTDQDHLLRAEHDGGQDIPDGRCVIQFDQRSHACPP